MNEYSAPFLYTVVTLPNGASAVFNHCVADVFTAGVLTITSTVDESEVELLDGWAVAVVYDHHGHIEYAHENRQAVSAAA